MKNKTAVIAIGGNSLIRKPEEYAIRHQREAVRETCKHIAEIIALGWDVVITHGNGPQVGFVLRKNELAAAELEPIPLDIIVSNTQGSIGFMLQQELSFELAQRGIERPCITLVTQTLVDRDDPAFENPSKPVGSFLSEERAQELQADGVAVVEDAGRGWRRVVPSPQPVEILEEREIAHGLAQGWVVVAVGGGGIPVIRGRRRGRLRGVEAVIDKDRASALLAVQLRAELFLISTGVEQVALNFNQPDQHNLSAISTAEAQQYLAEGQFAAGSMKPKIEACLYFLERAPEGATALITNPPNLAAALDGQTGTHIERS